MKQTKERGRCLGLTLSVSCDDADGLRVERLLPRGDEDYFQDTDPEHAHVPATKDRVMTDYDSDADPPRSIKMAADYDQRMRQVADKLPTRCRLVQISLYVFKSGPLRGPEAAPGGGLRPVPERSAAAPITRHDDHVPGPSTQPWNPSHQELCNLLPPSRRNR